MVLIGIVVGLDGELFHKPTNQPTNQHTNTHPSAHVHVFVSLASSLISIALISPASVLCRHTVIDLSPEFSIRHEDHKSIAKDVATNLIDDCTRASQNAIANTEQDPKSILDSLTECMSSAVEEEFIHLAEEISFQATLRKKMAESYENYTCADFNLTMSPSLENTTWYHAPSAKRHDVKILLDQPASRVHVIDNFVSQDQCDAMADAAKDRLQQAVVGDGSGGHELSKSRKALQAGIRVPWDKEKDGNPIATLSRKVYDYVNHATGLDIDEHGQEDLMSIQYFGRGMNDTEPDHYKPHCDGECTGDPHKNGTRVATIVMYCTIPEKGGATNFRNAGLHVVPEVGRAVFFSYMNPDDHLMDAGLTEHSGCPVIEGEKKIVTQWVRHGVTKEVPWNMYNSRE